MDLRCTAFAVFAFPYFVQGKTDHLPRGYMQLIPMEAAGKHKIAERWGLRNPCYRFDNG